MVMKEPVREIYLREIQTQGDFAINAIADLNSVLTRLPGAVQVGNHRARIILQQEVFRSIHSALTHASNLSRLLWPAPPRRQRGENRSAYRGRCASDTRAMRASDLRSILGLPEHGHVLRNRRMRDHLEHFDERLDEWQATSLRHNYVQDGIGPIGSIVGIETTDFMRWFDPATKQLWFRGEHYDLQACTTAVGTIRDSARERLEASMRARLRQPQP